MEKVLLKFRKIHRKTLVSEILKRLFCRTPPDDCFCLQLFRSSYRRCSMKNVFLKISQNSQENTFGLRNFQNIFFTKHLWTNASGIFCSTLLKMGVLSTVFGKPQMNIHYLETLTLEVPFRYIISFFGRINFQCISSLVYTVHCQKQPSEQRCSVKKDVLKHFVNFVGKHLCWSLFLIKLQA